MVVHKLENAITPIPDSIDESVRIQILADRIKMLFGFYVELIPDIDILEKMAQETHSKKGDALSMAPILSAVGIDYEEAELKWSIRNKRSEAILNLVKVLRDTDKEEKKFTTDKKNNAGAMEALRKHLDM